MEEVRDELRKNAARLAGVLLLAALTAYSAGGCGMMNRTLVRSGVVESPFYQLGDTTWDNGGVEEYYFDHLPSEDNETYRELYQRIKDYEDSAELYAGLPTEQFWTVYFSVINDHPEFFWIGDSVQVQESGLSGKVVSYSITTTVEKQNRDALRARLEEAADAIIAGVPEGASEYEKIKYVYEYLIDNTDYDSASPNNQNIQSVLLGHRSVCAGYAKAFQYILHRIGMFCTYVTGSTTDGGDHGWNIVRIGENYYHVDVTWGDPVFANQMDGMHLNATSYTYLCCTDEDIYRRHIPKTDVPLPACTDTSYDYYRLNGMYYDVFDWQTLHDAMMTSVWEDRSWFIAKFGSDEAYESAKRALFEEGMLDDAGQYLMEINGVYSWNYRYNTDDDFRLITVYWK